MFAVCLVVGLYYTDITAIYQITIMLMIMFIQYMPEIGCFNPSSGQGRIGGRMRNGGRKEGRKEGKE